MEEVLSAVRSSLAEIEPVPDVEVHEVVHLEPEQKGPSDDTEWEEYAGDEFVDAGEGAGVEGDLDIEED